MLQSQSKKLNTFVQIAIMAISGGALLAVSAGVGLNQLVKDKAKYIESAVTAFYIIFGVLLAVGITEIVLGSVMIGTKTKMERPFNKRIVISLIPFGIIMFALFVAAVIIAKTVGYIDIIAMLSQIMAAIYGIVWLRMKNDSASAVVTAGQAGTPVTDKEQSVAALKKMREEGKITEEEYKAMLLKEIEK